MNLEDSILERSDVFGLSDVEDDFEDDEEKAESLNVELLRFGTSILMRQYFSRESYPLETPRELLKDFGDAVKSFLRNCGRQEFIFLMKTTLYLHNQYDYRRERHVLSSLQNEGFVHTFANDHVIAIISVKFFKREEED